MTDGTTQVTDGPAVPAGSEVNGYYMYDAPDRPSGGTGIRAANAIAASRDRRGTRAYGSLAMASFPRPGEGFVLTHLIVSSDIDRSPVWLHNDGLHNGDTALIFIEITEMMEELARRADAAQNLPTMRDTPLSCSQRAATGMPHNPGIKHAPRSPQLVRAGACTAGAGVPAALGWVCAAR